MDSKFINTDNIYNKMELLNKYIILLVLILLFSCVTSKSQNSLENDLIEKAFSNKELLKVVEQYFGKGLCYKVREGSHEVKFTVYKKVNSQYGKSTLNNRCDDYDLVVFYFVESNVMYVQVFYTKGILHDFNEYPLNENNTVLSIEITFGERADIKQLRYNVIT